MSARKAIQYSVNLALIIAVVLFVAVCYFALVHPSKLDCVTYSSRREHRHFCVILL